MSHPEISLAEQADEAALIFVNMKGHRDNLERLVAAKKRPDHELQSVEARLPVAKAIRDTMRLLATNPDAARAAIVADRRENDEVKL